MVEIARGLAFEVERMRLLGQYHKMALLSHHTIHLDEGFFMNSGPMLDSLFITGCIMADMSC